MKSVKKVKTLKPLNRKDGQAVALVTRPSTLDTRSGFTMIEIAISLAIIGFALVAIIGILPQGMTVQKENRQETIINQDANMFLEAIRNGGKGFDDLTNYVIAITNYHCLLTGGAATPVQGPVQRDGYTYTGSMINDLGTGPSYAISNGLRIVGLLSTPRYFYITNSGATTPQYVSNYVIAYVRSMSGQASEKFPQNNPVLQDLAFGYRLMPEIAPYSYFEPAWTNFTEQGISAAEVVIRSNYWRVACTTATNLYDLRLTFRWPAFPNGKVGNDRQIFRTVASGRLFLANDFGMPLYFFEPRTYVKAKLP
jgi:prepilin-type N-terminal cleavage/methylation domain-containing protein